MLNWLIGQCNERNVFFENHAENEARRFALDVFLFFLEKALYEIKQLVSTLTSIYFGSSWLDINKNKRYKIEDCWSKNMLDFDF